MAEPNIGFITGIVRFITGWWEYYKKRPNIRIELEYLRKQEISDEAVAVMDLPKVKVVTDPKIAVIKLTNIGQLPAVISEFGVVVKGEEIILTRVPPKILPVSDNRMGQVITKTFPSSVEYAGNVYQYAAPNALDQLDFHRQYKAEVRTALFDYGIDDIYVKDTIGTKWSIDKDVLEKFYIQFDIDNPIPNPNRRK